MPIKFQCTLTISMQKYHRFDMFILHTLLHAAIDALTTVERVVLSWAKSTPQAFYETCSL